MIAWAIETLVATTLLMLLVLAIRTPIRRAFGPNVAYALWLLPVLRMMMPPLPATVRDHGIAPLSDASQQMLYYVVEPLAETPAVYVTGEGVPWALILLTSWAIGAGGFIAYHLISHRRFCANIRRQARATDWMADGRVEVIESDVAHGPLAFGIIRKTVAFPRDFAERYDDTERDLALAHELGHHARGDLIANWVALVMLAFHWFNPIAWKAFRAFRADQEMACDALVLSGREPSLRHAYGLAIVKSAHGGAVSAACHLHTINDLKGRLKMLLDNQKRSRSRVWGGTAASAAIGLIALGLTASGTHAAETVRATVEDRIGVKLEDVKLPSLAPTVEQEAPAAPAPVEVPESREPGEAAAPSEPRVLIEKDGTRIYRAERDGRKIVIHSRDSMDPAEFERMLERAERSRIDGQKLAADLQKQMHFVEGNCGPGEGTIHLGKPEADNGRRVTIICKDRIEKLAAEASERGARAQVLAMSSARMGTDMARMSLRHARKAIEIDRNLSAEQRAQALAGVDQAMAELDSQKDD
ncbi:M56 family metallopeptidase [Sphingomonas aestuarii]